MNKKLLIIPGIALGTVTDCVRAAKWGTIAMRTVLQLAVSDTCEYTCFAKGLAMGAF